MDVLIESELGLYVHVPFCSTTCDFCAFYQERPSKKGFEEYFFALERDFNAHRDSRNFSTVFIGGGTPGLLSAEQIKKLCKLIRGAELKTKCEWSVEVAPNEINSEKVDALLNGGVNRLSLGVQTFNQQFMNELGRDHDVDSVMTAYELVRNAGFTSVNLDLLFGAPGQTLEDWQDDLQKAVDLNPDHISTYCLTFEEDTALYAKLSKGEVRIDPEREASFYELAWEYLPAFGFSQYEVSNYAKPGMESLHNLNTWAMNEWIGYGPSASSQLNGVRRKNFANIEEWGRHLLLEEPQKYEEWIALEDAEIARDAVIFGLRMNRGINLGEICEKFHLSPGIFAEINLFLDLLIAEGLGENIEGNYCLNQEGRMRCDAIAKEMPELNQEVAVG